MSELGLVFGLAILGVAVSGYLIRWVLAKPTGDPDMLRVAGLVRGLAAGFFKRQTVTIAALSAVIGGAIFLAYGLLEPGHAEAITSLQLGVWTTIAFVVGAASAVAVGHLSVWLMLRANVRCATEARRSLDHALQVAIRGGAAAGLALAAVNLLGVANLFVAFFIYKGGLGETPAAALAYVPSFPLIVAGHTLGASSAALLAQLGAGTFAKASDLAADMASAEAGLVDDHARNPATMLDFAGDAVGNAGARAMANFQSSSAENLGAMLLGALVFGANPDQPSAFALVLFPLVVRALGVVATIFGAMVVRTDDREEPLNPLGRGLYVTSLLHLLGVAGVAKWLLGAHWLAFFGCGALGIALTITLFHLSAYTTAQRHHPVRATAEAACGGAALVVHRGLIAGLDAVVIAMAALAAAASGGYVLGGSSGLEHGGLLGIALVIVGMLGALGYVASLDGFGAIVDGAGGIIELSVGEARPDVRGRMLVLDGVGNSVKTFSKTHAACSAALGIFLLVAAFLELGRSRLAALGRHVPEAPFRVTEPWGIAAALVGVLLIIWFAARSLGAVAPIARRLLEESRRQLRDRPEDVPPDYERSVEMTTRAALRRMLGPAAFVAIAPVGVGLVLRLAATEDNPLLAVNSIAAMLLAQAIVGVLGSLLFGNAGGTWDNAKKYIVTGAHGGRYLVDEAGARTDNPTFIAAAIGDSVGDPLKDAAGPAVQVLVQLLGALAIVFLPFFL